MRREDLKINYFYPVKTNAPGKLELMLLYKIRTVYAPTLEKKCENNLGPRKQLI
jgi:hypothetical protein